MHVLVVDDSPVARRALAVVLEEEGLAVTESGSAGDARVAVHRHPPGAFDLILMDLHLPDGTGIETCGYIKGLHGWRDIPIIVVTSSDDDDDLRLAFAAGATDYITKPPRDVELLARVRAALGLKHEMDRRKARERELEQLNCRLTDQAAELTVAREDLVDLNRELERRVQAQVNEILTRAQEIEALNAQLRVQVQERSRELAEALRRLSGQELARQPLAPGTELAGRVRLVRPLARGGMGLVYLAEDLLTGSRVAVKLLDAQLGLRAEDVRRFINEAAAAAAIEHAAVVKTLHVDVSADGHLFLIMELVDGITLDVVLASGPLTPAWCVSVGAVVADALAAAHRAEVIHRDIKPGNLMVCREPPGVRVLDFGISKYRLMGSRETVTQTGGLLGTPAYMSPEQIEDPATVTPASDVYSLGAVMFEMVTGTPPFLANDFGGWLHLRASEEAPRVTDGAPLVSPSVAALIDQCLARDPAARPSSSELTRRLNDLARILDAPPPALLLDRKTQRASHLELVGSRQ